MRIAINLAMLLFKSYVPKDAVFVCRALSVFALSPAYIVLGTVLAMVLDEESVAPSPTAGEKG